MMKWGKRAKELWVFIRYPLELIGIWGWQLLLRNFWPNVRVFLVKFGPDFLSNGAVRHYRFNRTRRFAYAAIDTFTLAYDEHILAFVKTIDWANRYAVCVFAPYASIRHYERHVTPPFTARIRNNKHIL
jgi:hypothetical protein